MMGDVGEFIGHGSEWDEVQPDIEGRSRVSERADRDEVHAGFSDLAKSRQGDTAAGFQQGSGMLTAGGDSLAHFREAHVIEQNVIDPFQSEEGA